MLSASWTPEQWTAIIGVITLSLVQLIKTFKTDKTTKAVADDLAVKVDTNTRINTSSHRTVDSKLDDVLGILAHGEARLTASDQVRQVLSERVDEHTVQLRNHDTRLRNVEGKIGA